MMQQDGRTGSGHVEGISPGVESLLRLAQVLFFGLRILIVVIFVFLLFSGVFYVDEQEAAMLFRFGALQERVLDPAQGKTAVLTSGHWYWAWPYPIDSTKRIPAQKSITLRTEGYFWPQINPNQIDVPDSSMANQPLRPGEGGYLLTGDMNIMHTIWSITYRVTDPKKYYLNFYDDEEASGATKSGSDTTDRKTSGARGRKARGAEAVIRNVLANAVLAETGTWRVENVLVASRPTDDVQGNESLKDRVRDRVTAKLDRLEIGVAVQEVNLVETQPPLATQQAFREVVEAAQTRRERIESAQAYAADVVPRAQGDAYRIIDEAKAYKTRVVESVKAESNYFQTVLEEYRKSPETMLVALHADVVRDVLKNVETKYVLHAGEEGHQEIRLRIGPEPEKPGAANSTETMR